MIFVPTEVAGAWIIEPELNCDERGGFARTWCRRVFEERGLNSQLVQCSISINRQCGTVRGMHFQSQPHAETKLVRCTRGAIFDVVVDLRPESATFAKWVGHELTEKNHRMFYVPEGCAHGFQTLADDVEIFYQNSQEYRPENAAGVRWNDPAINVQWPLPVGVILPRDVAWPDLTVPNSDHR